MGRFIGNLAAILTTAVGSTATYAHFQKSDIRPVPVSAQVASVGLTSLYMTSYVMETQKPMRLPQAMFTGTAATGFFYGAGAAVGAALAAVTNMSRHEDV
jgi:hypothetical protein